MRWGFAALPVFLLVGIFAHASLSDGPAPAAATRINIEPVVWRFGQDYPGAHADDTNLPVDTVYIKTHDGIDWMSAYDPSPDAVSGPAKLRQLVAAYRARGIDVVAWFVPKAVDIETQVVMAEMVIDTGVRGLYADVEPYDGFCNIDCGWLAKAIWERVRADRPNASLGVIYDPRPWHWEKSGLFGWLSHANVALPMCYWETFISRSPWNDPAGCVRAAHADLVGIMAGRPIEYIPMLQGDSSAEKILRAVMASEELGATSVSLWRRGLVSSAAWQTLAVALAPTPPPQPGYPCTEDTCAFFGSDGVDWVMYAGIRFDLSERLAAYVDEKVPYLVTDELLATIASSPPDGTMLASATDGTRFVAYGGALWPHIPGAADPPAPAVPPAALAQIPLTPVDGTLLREAHSETMFMVLSGTAVPVSTGLILALGLSEANVHVICAGGLEHLPMVRDGSGKRWLRANPWSSGPQLLEPIPGITLADLQSQLPALAPNVTPARAATPSCRAA